MIYASGGDRTLMSLPDLDTNCELPQMRRVIFQCRKRRYLTGGPSQIISPPTKPKTKEISPRSMITCYRSPGPNDQFLTSTFSGQYHRHISAAPSRPRREVRCPRGRRLLLLPVVRQNLGTLYKDDPRSLQRHTAFICKPVDPASRNTRCS